MKFEAGNLQSLENAIELDNMFSGYLQFEFNKTPETNKLENNFWNIYFSNGKIVFSHNDEINLNNILNALAIYLPILRNPNTENKILMEKMIAYSEEKSDIAILKLLLKLMLQTKLVDYQKITQSIKTYLINDLETHLFRHSATIKIIPDKKIDLKKPIIGFDLSEILAIIKDRKNQWQKYQEILPSLDIKLICNKENSKWNNLPNTQKEKITQLLNLGETVKEIQYSLGEDSLKITTIFAQLLEQQLVINPSIKTDSPIIINSPQTKSSLPKIAVIDDSIVLLKQFQSIVNKWGYQVRCCHKALEAVSFLIESPPQIIFLDVNMPYLSGFDLIKQIRQQEKLKSIPLVILTSENTIINNYRAKWSKSQFLTKPLTTEEMKDFQANLKEILEKNISEK